MQTITASVKRITRVKVKSPEWHELQRLKHLSRYVEKRIGAGAYDESPDTFEQANKYLEAINAKVNILEGKAL